MNSYERVLLTLNHTEPDVIPFDLGGTPMTGIHKAAYQKFKRFLNLDDPEKIEIEDTMQQLARVEDSVHLILKTDVRKGLARASDIDSAITYDDGDYRTYSDVWGIVWRKPNDGGFYYDMHSHLLEKAENLNEIKKYQWPDPMAGNSFEGIREKVLKIIESGYMPAVGGFCPGVTTMHAWLRGFEKFFMDFYLNPEIAEFLMDKVQEIKLLYWEKILEQIRDIPCVLIESDDLGSQNNTLYSPEIYRRFVKPRHRSLFHSLKANSKAKIFLHSCGSIRKLIADLIDAGIDILNPVQKSAAGMDIVELKKTFGNDLVFWGGGVDTQRILGEGSVQQVKDDVKQSIDALAPGGGFVFATVHNIQATVPPENIVAMWETLKELGQYH